MANEKRNAERGYTDEELASAVARLSRPRNYRCPECGTSVWRDSTLPYVASRCDRFGGTVLLERINDGDH